MEGNKTDTCKLFELAKPYLEKNDFGIAHTQRVFEIAKKNFPVKTELEEVTYTAIIFHDIGGCTIKDQYEKGPQLISSILKKLGSPDHFINGVCKIISTHHDHPQNHSEPFKTLYDSDKLAMFSSEEYPYYNAQEGFDWDKIVSLIYSSIGRDLAKKPWRREEKKMRSGRGYVF